MTRRYYRIRALEARRAAPGRQRAVRARHLRARGRAPPRRGHARRPRRPADALRALAAARAHAAAGEPLLADLYAREPRTSRPLLDDAGLPASRRARRVRARPARGRVDVATFSAARAAAREDRDLRGMHPMMAERMDLWRLANFELERLPSAARRLPVPRGGAREPARRAPRRARRGARPHARARRERPHHRAARSSSAWCARRSRRCARSSPAAARASGCCGTACCSTRGRRWTSARRGRRDHRALRAHDRRARARDGHAARADARGRRRARPRAAHLQPGRPRRVVELGDPPTRAAAAARRGRPADRLRAPARHAAPGRDRQDPRVAPSGDPAGEFVEHDLDDDGELVPVDRPPATNRASIVVGLIRNRTERYPEGMLRVALLGDPTRALGSLAEPECRRIIAALDLAEQLGVPVEWFARLVGRARSRWTPAPRTWTGSPPRCGGSSSSPRPAARSTSSSPASTSARSRTGTPRRRCSCTRKGILVMTPESAMVLTGKQALDYSGGVSAEDNFGIGGYERIMGPNGQAQYWAPDLAGACELLLRYYEHTYVAPGERFPRRAATTDPVERDVRSAPHEAPGLRPADRRRDLRRGDEPGPQEAVRHPLGDARGGRRRPRAARALGGHARGGDRGRLGRPPRRPAGGAARHRVAAAAALRLGAGRRAGAVDARARCSRRPRRRSRARSTPRPGGGRWSCSPTWPASTARRSRCAGCSSSTAPRSGARS